MNRANRSLARPKASGLYEGRVNRLRRTSRGWSRRALSRSAMGHLVPLLTPVIGEDVVEHVVDRDRPDEAALLVHDRDPDEVVRREDAGDLPQRRVRLQRLDVLVQDRADRTVRGV